MDEDALDRLIAATRLAGSEITITQDELEQLCGKDGGIRWDHGTVMACRADGTVVKILRKPDDPPLRIV